MGSRGTTVPVDSAAAIHTDGLFGSKFVVLEPGVEDGALKAAGGSMLQTTLKVQSGDSGGPLFNENGEVLGINLRREIDASGASDSVAVCNHNRTMLTYLDQQLKNVKFKEKWQFLIKPSYWQRNRLWIMTGSTVAVAGTAVVLLSGKVKEDLPDLTAGTPTAGNQ